MTDRRLKKVEFYKKIFPKKFPIWNPAKFGPVARLMEKKWFDGDELYCLPKDGVIEVGKSVDTGEMVLPSEVVEHFIREASYRFVMDFCICRESMPCTDYPHELGCVFLGEGARGIHPGLGREATVEEALDHVRKAREAGLVYSVGKSKLDTVWLETGPGEKLFTICNCCPCCCITRGIAVSHKILSEKYSRMPGVKLTVTDDCVGCGDCVEPGVCIFGAISLDAETAEINDNCRGCGRCAETCPNHAIEVMVDESAYVDETIKRLSARINVK